MRILMAATLAALMAQPVTADEDNPQDALWRVQSCRNPGLSYEIKKSAEPGAVTALFDIQANGRVTNIRVKNAENSHGMDMFVRNSLKRWRYFAYFKDGQEAARRDVSVTFTYDTKGEATCTHTPLPETP